MRSIPAALAVVILFIFFGCSRQAAAPQAASALQVDAALTAGVVDAYRAWVLAESDAFLERTEAFVAAVAAGDRETAKKLYAPARMHFERIEPIAEALGDFDPRIDAREGDVSDAEWRGYHKLEKLLWSADDLKAGGGVAALLAEDVRLLRAQLETAGIDIGGMVTGAVELLNEVSTSKVTGEEERYSRTDLWDFQANVEGAAKIYELLAPATRAADAALADTLDRRFGALQALLDAHRAGDGFKLYGDLKPEEVKALAAAVDGVAEPLSSLGKIFPAGGGSR